MAPSGVYNAVGKISYLLPIPGVTPCSIWFGSSDFRLTMISSEQDLQKASAKRGNVIKKSLFSSIFSTLGGQGAARINSYSTSYFKESRLGGVSCLLYNWFISVMFHIQAPREAPRGLRPSPCLPGVTHPWFDSSDSLTFYQASPEAHKHATTTGLKGSLLTLSPPLVLE